MIGLETTVSLDKQFRLQWEEAQQCHVLLFPEGSMAWDERYVAGAVTRMGETLGLSQ